MRSGITVRKITVVAIMASVLSGFAVTPVASIYIESYAELQKQLFKGAELFNSPELGAVPMMLTMAFPGIAQVDTAKPVAIHFLNMESADPGIVFEVSAIDTPAAYLEAVLGRAPAELGAVHRFDGGAIRVHGGLVQIAPASEDLEELEQAGNIRLPAMPEVPGVIRAVVFTTAIKPWLEEIEETIDELLPLAVRVPGQTMDAAGVNLMADLIAQTASWQLGINIGDDGLELHSCVTPLPDTELAQLITSQKAIPGDLLATGTGAAMVWLVSGGYTMPPPMADKLAALKQQRLTAKYRSATADQNATADFATLVQLGLRAHAAPYAVSASVTASALQTRATVKIANAPEYFTQWRAAMNAAPLKALLAYGGLAVEEAAPRTYKGTTIQRCLPTFNADTFKANGEKAIPTTVKRKKALEHIEQQASLKSLFWGLVATGGECAHTADALVYGTGTPQMIEDALDNLGATALPAAEAARIITRLTPQNAPVGMGRVTLSRLICAVAANLNNVDRRALAGMAKLKGDAIIFARWLTNSEERSLVLIPADEVKALRRLVELQISSSDNDDSDEVAEVPAAEASAVEPEKTAVTVPTAAVEEGGATAEENAAPAATE